MATGLLSASWQAENFVDTTLSSDITASDTDIFLANVPTQSEGTLVINPDSSTKREIIYYNSKSATKVVCPSAALGRGYDNTTATSHTQGTRVIMAPVADWFRSIAAGTALANSSVTPEKLLTGTGPSWVWQTWTPTWTNLTVGNGTVSARYKQIGKTVTVTGVLTLGTTSSVGSNPFFSLPVTQSSSYILTGNNYRNVGIAHFADDSAGGNYLGSVSIGPLSGTGNAFLLCQNASAVFVTEAGLTATTPFTWTVGDIIDFTLIYEAA